MRARLGKFVDRAVEEGLIDPDLPPGWALTTLLAMIDAAAHRFEDLPPGRAADLVVASLLGGVSPA